MKIYLAGGMTIMTGGREKELSEKMPTWKRLFSFHFIDKIESSEILEIKEQDLKNYKDQTNEN